MTKDEAAALERLGAQIGTGTFFGIDPAYDLWDSTAYITSGHWDADRWDAGRQRGKSTTGLNRYVIGVNTTILPAPPPRKKHRYTPPPRRLDGRR